jgi:transcriptional regulator with PAS, ATPase and Fis domain
VGRSEKMLTVFKLIEQIARTDSTVLVTGESGTGKDWVARAIHFYSLRRERPFVALNCGAVPENLLESELFGYMKGAFTGAGANKKGLIEAAERGTLFLDEIGEMSMLMQVKLLRVLQERKFRRLGGVEELESAMRVIAATNQDLTKMVADGKFREDLFYRINVIPIHLPPLRDRGEDIPLLAEYFLGKYREQMGKTISALSQQSMELLEAYEWPGNIRELENMIKRIVILQDESLVVREMSRAPRSVAAYAAAGAGNPSGVAAEESDELDSESGDEEPQVPVAMAPAGSRLADVAKAAAVKAERAIIEDTLGQVQWNRRRAAEQLGVSYKTLLNKIKECGISRK